MSPSDRDEAVTATSEAALRPVASTTGTSVTRRRWDKELGWAKLGSIYVPIIVALPLLIIGSFYGDLFKSIPVALLVAVIELTFVAIAGQLSERLVSFEKRVDALGTRLTSLEATQHQYLD